MHTAIISQDKHANLATQAIVWKYKARGVFISEKEDKKDMELYIGDKEILFMLYDKATISSRFNAFYKSIISKYYRNPKNGSVVLFEGDEFSRFSNNEYIFFKSNRRFGLNPDSNNILWVLLDKLSKDDLGFILETITTHLQPTEEMVNLILEQYKKLNPTPEVSVQVLNPLTPAVQVRHGTQAAQTEASSNTHEWHNNPNVSSYQNPCSTTTLMHSMNQPSNYLSTSSNSLGCVSSSSNSMVAVSATSMTATSSSTATSSPAITQAPLLFMPTAKLHAAPPKAQQEQAIKKTFQQRLEDIGCENISEIEGLKEMIDPVTLEVYEDPITFNNGTTFSRSSVIKMFEFKYSGKKQFEDDDYIESPNRCLCPQITWKEYKNCQRNVTINNIIESLVSKEEKRAAKRNTIAPL